MIVADESVERSIVERLRQDGLDVLAIAEVARGAPDESVLERANDAGAVLITADKDFGDLVYLKQQGHQGVVLLRLAGLPKEEKAELVSAAFRLHIADFPGSFTVIAKKRIRIRKKP